MIRPLVAVLLLSSASMAAEAEDRDWGPLTLGHEGLLQCYEPDAEAHSCRSLAAYAWGDGDEIDNLAEVLMSRDPWVVMRVTSPVTLQGDAICGPYRKEDLEAATFEVGGAPADDATSARLRANFIAGMPLRDGAMVCTRYLPDEDGDQLVTEVSIDGKPAPEFRERVIWVDAGDGWVVK